MADSRDEPAGNHCSRICDLGLEICFDEYNYQEIGSLEPAIYIIHIKSDHVF